MKKIIFLLLLFSVSTSNAQSWKPVGGGVIQSGGAIAHVLITDTLNHLLYVGGGFDSAGNVNTSNNIAIWDGANWSGLTNGNAPFGISSMAQLNNSIYVCNNLNNSVERWNGTNWTTLPSFDNYVQIVAVVNNELYAGGSFKMQGSTPMEGIAKWTGSSWAALGSGVGDFIFPGPTFVDAIVEYQGKLIAAGYFPRAGTDTVYNIAEWDGSNWTRLGSGMFDGMNANNDYVYDLLVIGNDLYAGGRFTNAGGVLVNGIAKWDGNVWRNLGNGADYGTFPGVSILGKYQDELFAYGSFGSTYGLAKWTGIDWESYHSEELSSVGAYLNDMIEFNDEFYIGGNFHTDTSGQELNNIARNAIVDLTSLNTNCFNTCTGTSNAPSFGINPDSYLWSTGDTTESIFNLCAGDYSVTVTDSTGSSSYGTVTVESPPAIVITTDSTNATCATCTDGSATINNTSGGTPPYNYLWTNGATTNSIDNLLSGAYTVKVTDANGCAVVDSVTVGFDVGVQQLIIDNGQLIIYPNPTTSSITVSCNTKIERLVITNLVGEIIYQSRPNQKNTSLQLANSGMYFITVTAGGVTATRKLIVQE